MTTEAQRDRIEARLDAYLAQGMTQDEANDIVRKENEEVRVVAPPAPVVGEGAHLGIRGFEI